MAEPTPVAFSGTDVLEAALINLGAAQVRSRKIGRYSNYQVYAPTREAVVNTVNQTVLGRIVQYNTKEAVELPAGAAVVQPRCVLFLYEEASSGNLFLLKTNGGCGPNGTLKYNVWRSDEKFSPEYWVYALKKTAGAPFDDSRFYGKLSSSNAAQAGPSQSTIAQPSTSTQSTTSQPSTLPQAASNAINQTSTSFATASTTTAAADDDEDDQSEAVSPIPSAAPKPTKGRKTATKTKKTKQTKSLSTKAPSIPKSSAGIKKSEQRQKSPVPVRQSSRRVKNKDDAVLSGRETTEAAFLKAAEAGKVLANARGDRAGTRSRTVALNSSAEMFPSHNSKGVKPPSARNPATLPPATSKKRAREVEEDLDDAEIHRRAKRLMTGWSSNNNSSSATQNTTENEVTRSLVGVHVVARIGIKKKVTDTTITYVMDDKKKMIKYDVNARETPFGSDYPADLALQTTVSTKKAKT